MLTPPRPRIELSAEAVFAAVAVMATVPALSTVPFSEAVVAPPTVASATIQPALMMPPSPPWAIAVARFAPVSGPAPSGSHSHGLEDGAGDLHGGARR